MSEQDEANRATELIEGGSAVAGAAVGAAVGLLGGPVGVVGGAAGGAFLGRVLKRVGSEIRQRRLGPRESVRVGAAAAFAGQQIQAHLSAGEVPRNDDFFEGNGPELPPAEQLLEGVLLKARDAYEERKLRLLGALYANVAFHPEISPPHANQLINLAGQLTYRQLVALSVAGAQQQQGPLYRDADYRGDDAAIAALGVGGISLITELYDLYQRGLVSDSAGEAWISVADVAPGRIRPQGSGSILHDMMGLASIPARERTDFDTHLR